MFKISIFLSVPKALMYKAYIIIITKSIIEDGEDNLLDVWWGEWWKRKRKEKKRIKRIYAYVGYKWIK